MTTENKYLLGDDLPKKDPWNDDRLGVSPFAERLSKVIQNLQAPNGYVIGLHGAWGSGKSTVLNFVAAHLEKFNQESTISSEKIEIIDFRPWIIAGHQDLIAAFFKLLSENLGPRDRWLKRQWKRAIKFFGFGSDKLIDTVATLAVTIDPTMGVASGTVGAITKRSLGNIIDRFLQEPSLQVTHQRLVEQLALCRRKFLVVIDDLDRLEDEDIREIMRMVKTIGHLPNVIYLLAYDREIVWKALENRSDRVGPRFAEKIVQQDLELPKPSSNALLSILEKQTAFLPPPADGSMRWFYIVSYGIQRWVRSPRDVLRLGNAVKFSWSALDGEIDPQDLLAMEGLKLFDTEAFNWIRDNRDFIFSEGPYRTTKDEVNREAVENLTQRLQEADKLQAMEVISAVFPQVAKWKGERQHLGGEAYFETIKRRGISSEAGYDSYFSLYPTINAVPKTVIEDVMANLDNAKFIEGLFRAYLRKFDDRGESLISSFLDEIHARFLGNDPAHPTQQLLDALFRVGGEISALDSRGRAFISPPRAKIWFLIKTMLENWGIESSGKHLIQALDGATNPAFHADIYVSCGRENGTFESYSSSAQSHFVKKEDFDALGSRLLLSILEAEKNGTLQEAPYYFDIVRSWAHLGDASDAKAWISQGMMGSAEFMAKTGQGLLTHSVGERTRTYQMREKPNTIIYDLDVIVAAGDKHLAGNELDDETRSVISEMTRGAKAIIAKKLEE